MPFVFLRYVRMKAIKANKQKYSSNFLTSCFVSCTFSKEDLWAGLGALTAASGPLTIFLNPLMSSRRSEDHVSRRRRRGGTVETVGRVLEGVNGNNTSTARPGCQRRRGCCYYLTHSRDSTSGRHAPYPVNLHTNTAQGDEHGNLPSAES